MTIQNSCMSRLCSHIAMFENTFTKITTILWTWKWIFSHPWIQFIEVIYTFLTYSYPTPSKILLRSAHHVKSATCLWTTHTAAAPTIKCVQQTQPQYHVRVVPQDSWHVMLASKNWISWFVCAAYGCKVWQQYVVLICIPDTNSTLFGQLVHVFRHKSCVSTITYLSVLKITYTWHFRWAGHTWFGLGQYIQKSSWPRNVSCIK